MFVDDHPGPNYGARYKVRRRCLKSLCERAGVDPPFGFHDIRSYVASYLADEKKVSAKTIQRILRHKNVTTTERYIKAVNQDLKQVLGMLGQGMEDLGQGQGGTESTGTGTGSAL